MSTYDKSEYHIPFINTRNTIMTQENTTKYTKHMLKNITLNWVKLDTPTDNYSGDKKIYEIQACVPIARAAELDIFRKTRPAADKSMVCINLSKNAFKKDGSENLKVRVVDINKNPLDSKTIGNGSVANVIVTTSPYEIKNPKTGKVTKSGVSTMLDAVQVTKLIKYEPKNSMDFDAMDGEVDATDNDDQF